LRRVRHLRAFLVLFGAGACGGTHEDPPRLEELSIALEPPPSSVWTLSRAPMIELGRAEDVGPLFHRVESVALSADGSMLIADAGDARIHRFAPDGTHLGSYGRMGFGPGEFRTLAGVVSRDDGSLVAFDPAMPRFTTFSASGEVLETRVAEAPTAHGVSLDVLRLLASLPGERYLLAPARVVVWPRSSPSLFEEVFPILVYDARGRVVGPLGPMWRMEMWGDETSSAPLPFAGRSFVWGAGDRVLIAQSGSGRIEVWNPDGHRIRELVMPGTPPVVTREMTHAWVQARVAGAAHMPGVAEYRGWLERMPFPNRAPFFDDFVLDSMGRIWLRNVVLPGSETESGWTVLDDGGIPLARIRLPVALRPRVIQGHRIVGIWTDSLSVQSVRVYRFDDGTGGGDPER
jgi:hypothetical protein